MKFLKPKIIMSWEEFAQVTRAVKSPIAYDIETAGDFRDTAGRKIIGFSLSNEELIDCNALYLPLWAFDDQKGTLTPQLPLNNASKALLTQTIGKWELIAQNFIYDKKWTETIWGIRLNFIADTMLMAHMSDNPLAQRSYGLESLQKDILHWPTSGKNELKQHILTKFPKIARSEWGAHIYAGNLEVVGHYACLDSYSTYGIFRKLRVFFNQHNYWDKLTERMQYVELLELNTDTGVRVSKTGLETAKETLTTQRQEASEQFLEGIKDQLKQLDDNRLDEKLSNLTRPNVKQQYVNGIKKLKPFNLNSDKDKIELFYGILKLPVKNKTDSGKPQVNIDTLSLFKDKVPALEHYLRYNSRDTVLNNFLEPYFDKLVWHKDHFRIHPGFNITGTVSYRLSGRKPYLLNAPFDEFDVYSNFVVDPGYVGLGYDLRAIEPTITAHYSKDRTLLKVFRDGLGDVYLDLALYLFPNDSELKAAYNPNIPITSAIKEQFKKQRDIAKTIFLAVNYTGTATTVSKNLTSAGYPTDRAAAARYVKDYWDKFGSIARWERSLQLLFKQQGFLKTCTGLIIRPPFNDFKDTMNRFVQASGHDVLVQWNLLIWDQLKEQKIDAKPVVADIHDFTGWQVRESQLNQLKSIMEGTLKLLSESLRLSVEIKAEGKTFHTLAGLKVKE